MKKYKAGSFCFDKEIIYYTDDFISFYKENDEELTKDDMEEWAVWINETVLNPPAELGRLADASGDKQSTRIYLCCIIGAGLANRTKSTEAYSWTIKVYHIVAIIARTILYLSQNIGGK